MTITANPIEHMWEQKYRPQSISECILPKQDREVFEGIIKEGRCPHTILVSPSPGTGKTTVARALCNDIDVEMYFVNGADCKIDFIRDRLTRFASTSTSKKGGKVIVIDEFDRKQLADAQRHLRSFMEEYSHNCSIIITANNADGIISPLKSRSRVIEFGNPTEEDKMVMMKEMIIRCKKILELENVEIQDMRVLAALVKQNFPDLRKTITEMDRYAKKGVIDSGILAAMSQASDIESLISAMKDKDFKTIRGLVGRYTQDYPTFVTKLYNTMYGSVVPASIPNVILTIGDNQKYHQQVANLEIHISMMLVQLMLEVQWK